MVVIEAINRRAFCARQGLLKYVVRPVARRPTFFS